MIDKSNGHNGRDLNTSLELIENAILQTVAYGDVFQFPLTAAEIHRYLVGVAATRPAVTSALESGRLVPRFLSHQSGYYALVGEERNFALRGQRVLQAQTMWPAARRYARLISHLPFVRMVAVTGSLAMNSPMPQADVDYLVVTKQGRVWLCRALVVAIVKYAARRSVHLCPNYFVAENSLLFSEQDLYTARELTQMVPLSGFPVYSQMRRLNRWTDRFLPNASGPPHQLPPTSTVYRVLPALTELPLLGPFGSWLDEWELSRKLRKFGANAGEGSESGFSKDWCKGHFDGHHGRTMSAYRQRLGRAFEGLQELERPAHEVLPL